MLLDTRQTRQNLFEEAERIKDIVAKFQAAPLSDTTGLTLISRNHLDAAWNQWKKFAQSSGCGIEQPWLDVCMGKDQQCSPYFRAFIFEYLRASKVLRPCLDEREWHEVQTIGQAATLIDVWSKLIRAANVHVIKPRKRAEPHEGRWNLEYCSQRGEDRNQTLVDIGKWIVTEAENWDLSLEQSFEKSESTTEDILRLLQTLWKRAADIPCTKEHRLSFHNAIILLGIGGWRSKSVLDLQYEDVEIARVRDPETGKANLVATITIHHVKQRRLKVHRDQKKRQFSITFIPCKTLCVLSLILSKAFADNAFYGEYRTLQELLPSDHQFVSEDVHYEKVPWRDEMYNKKINNLSYHRLLEIWTRTRIVMGARTGVRIYSLRVGTAGKLDGQLTPALRNYILSQSSGVYESSYHPVQIRENLMKISFGRLAGLKDQLIDQMTRMSLRCDPGAPIYITKEDLEGFEKRKDLTLLRSQPPSAAVQSKIKYIRDTLEALLLDKRRQEYFDNVDKKKPIDQANAGTTDPRRKMQKAASERAALIAPFFEDEISSSEFIQILVGFLTGSEIVKRPKVVTVEKPKCVLCSRTFVNRQALSRHVWDFHTFEHPFKCLECHRIGNGPVIVPAGRDAWSRHLADYHGKAQVPNPESAKTAYCPFCAKTTTPRGFFLHYKNHETKIGEPFWCPECTKAQKRHWVDGGSEDWIQHLRTSHNGDWNIHGAVILGKRKVEDGEVSPCKRAKTSRLQAKVELKCASERQCEQFEDGMKSGSELDWTPDPIGEHDGEEFWVPGDDRYYSQFA
ncbi:hypothetical protein FGADI_4548 [Fusarium gaditjirri]|uniref:C2H2-type domain-containing protein n=1 Tax=Fusarium gaditjirri TaxID=282569 RepID=A0A8H4TCL3_9HYPO|nr:hypothetical protein FGADI_4548 [Fusarium gaditjirri]